jgi:chromosome segregation ATPase
MNPSAERAAPLLESARQRHDDARRRTVEALRRLDASGASVTVAAVARVAGVSRAWLYRQHDLLPTIEHLRQRPATTASRRPSAERASTDSLHQQLDALRARCSELQAENQQLREALARRLGARRQP